MIARISRNVNEMPFSFLLRAYIGSLPARVCTHFSHISGEECVSGLDCIKSVVYWRAD